MRGEDDWIGTEIILEFWGTRTSEMGSSPTAAEAEALIPRFKLEKLLNQDQGGRRISLLGTIDSRPALLLAERAAFPSTAASLTNFSTSLKHITNLGANDVYSWFLANSDPCRASTPSDADNGAPSPLPPDLKLNLIYPCGPRHVAKYSAQGVRVVTETPGVYERHVRPRMETAREAGKLDWIWNIIEGRAEQEDVFYRERGEEGFLVIPDLNWDRKTLTSLHVLAIVERGDIWSLRDLSRKHLNWLRHMRQKIVDATVKLYPEIESDQLKLYVHYQPTYYHFHVHVVHACLEAGTTQAVGKAFGLDNVISQLDNMNATNKGDGAGMADVDITYNLGEQSELWQEVFLPIKEGRLE
ncbi:scavenger mRNA decapping enzyme [Lineolata rhizophorae]|uniref:Scavenger mRNA decapping enzyme n=1 Tax=Lineolata rhizophorae TaxID=578093 RepID=A0A6A6P633_9PEZI|nr:scavenger mRNA decapping enzyme [Lineolata rhizophorae]